MLLAARSCGASRLVASATTKTTPAQSFMIALGSIAFLYFARPVILPIFLACGGAMTLKPIIRWLSFCHIRPALSAAVVLCLLVSGITIGFLRLGHPALAWMNEAPQHITELRQRVQKLFPRFARFSLTAAAVNNLGATEEEKKEEQKKAPTVEVRDSRGTGSVLNWTGTFLAGVGETLVLLYLLLASGDLFLQKLVRVMPTLSDKKRAVDISHEIQQNISNYLLSVCLINFGLGIVVSAGLYWFGVPNATMWGVLVAMLNFVPYFGPVAGLFLLVSVGLLTFDTLGKGLLPSAHGHVLIHLLEANLVTPVLAWAALSTQSSRYFCFLDFLRPGSGVYQELYYRCRSWSRSKSFVTVFPRYHPSVNCSRVERNPVIARPWRPI